MADGIDGFVVHLEHHDGTMLCMSRAPLEKLDAYKRRMGWSFSWVSSFRAPKGRNEAADPQWMRRHDEYEEAS